MKTKKQLTNRILSLVLTFVMVLGMMPMSTLTAFAADGHSHPICGATHTDVGDHTGACANIAWKKWESTNSMPTEAGAYYLVSDVTLSSTWEIPEGLEISLCLNGHSVSGNNAVRVVTVNKTATLNLCDCSSAQTGKITEGYRSDYSGAGVWVYTGSTLNLYGGSIVKNKTPYQGGGVYIFQGTFNMYGGSISDNTALDGAGVFNNSGTINIYAGDIAKNKASRMGGGVNHNSGKFYMTGGNISQNEVTGYQQYCHGGGVFHNYGRFEMSGGTISGNSATTGAGIYVAYASKWLVSGVPIINDAIYLNSEQYGTAYITVCGDLNDKASFAATNRGVGEAIAKGTDTYFVTESDVAKFATNAGAIYVDSVGNRLVLCNDSHPEYEDGACKTCGTECEHILVYESNQNVITENCNAESNCGYEEKATLSANTQFYSGTSITPATITYSDGWRGEKVENTAIIYDKNLNIGTATASVILNGKTATKSFEIKAADIAGATITLNPASGTYTGNEQQPTVAVVWNDQTLTENTDYELSWDKTVFTDPDTYTVTVTGKGNFAGSKTQTFNINAASLTDVKVEQVGTLTYNGKSQTPIVSANAVAVNNQPLTFIYSPVEDGTYDSMPSFTQAGTYTVYYKATAPNHNEATGSFTVTVDKATVTAPTIASKVYNGSEQKADITDTDLYTVTQNNGGTGVRQYNVILKLKDAANYKWSSIDDAEITVKFAITRATNEWTATPSITGWTYGETAKAPVGSAKFGDVVVTYKGEDYAESITAPTEAGNYTATFIVAETEDYSGLETSVDFAVAKADQAAPTGLTKTDTTYFGKADGKISGLTSAMEFRKEGDSTYTAGFNGTLEYLAAGTYYVRYQGDANHNPSPDAVVTVNAGRKLQIVVPQNQVGYTVTVNKTEMEYEGSYTLKVEIHEGYTATEDFKIIISNWECGQQPGVEETYMNAIADQIIEVQGVADITAPTAEIKIENNKWTSLWNDLTFGLFFKETQDVTITATDKGSGIKSIEYYLAHHELGSDELEAIANWTEYNGTFKIDDERGYIIYARAIDNSGNIMYINSDGIILDKTAPIIHDIEEGGKYYGMNVFNFNDEHSGIASLKIDGVETPYAPAEPSIFITPDNAEHTVTVTDKAGNVTEYKITVYKNYTVTYKADGEVVATVTVGHGENAAFPKVPKKDGFVGKWDRNNENITSDTVINAVYTEIDNVVPDELKTDDKSELEDTKKQLEAMLDDDSYTEDDKKDIQKAIDGIDDALEVIGNIEEVEELIDKLPENITKKDEDAIKAAEDAYNALSDYEKSLVDEDAKKALDDAKAALAELNKPADTTSPNTGDNSNLWLWVALLFISGGAVITLTVVDKKKRAAQKYKPTH